MAQSVKCPNSWLRSWVEPLVGLYDDSSAWSLLRILCLPLSAPPSPTHTVFLSKNKHWENSFKWFFFFSFLLFLGEHKWGRRRERGTEDPKQALHWQAHSSGPDVGLKLTNCEIMTGAKVGGSIDWATQVPPNIFFQSVACLFILLMPLAEQKFLSLMKSNLSIFKKWVVCLVFYLRIPCLNQGHKLFLL